MNFFQSFKILIQFIRDAVKELNNNLGLYLVYVVLISLSTAVPNLMNAYYNNNNVIIQIFAKLVFYIIPLLVLSKIFYVVKIRNFGEGDFFKTFFAYLIYSVLFLLIMLFAGGLALLPVYLTFVTGLSKWLLGFTALGNILLIYCMIFFSFTPMIAAIENESSDNFFSRSKNLVKKNIPLVLMNQVLALFIFLLSSSVVLIKNSSAILGISIVMAVIDAVVTIILTLTAVKIYSYLNEME